MKVSALYFYPVKSLRGAALQRMSIDRRGPVMDRRWMLVTGAGRFVTQREQPRMALVGTRLERDALIVTAPEMPSLRLPYPSRNAADRTVRVWRDQCSAVDCGDGAAEWFSALLGSEFRLVFMPETTHRPVDPAYAGPGDSVAFVDGYPFLLTATASLADLNERLHHPVPMIRFRPNIVVDGGDAFAEDGWRRLRIGALTLRAVKPCARCSIPTIDLDTGRPSAEPLRTLKRYRRGRGGVLFGQNLIHDETGEIAVGDTVEILD